MMKKYLEHFHNLSIISKIKGLELSCWLTVRWGTIHRKNSRISPVSKMWKSKKFLNLYEICYKVNSTVLAADGDSKLLSKLSNTYSVSLTLFKICSLVMWIYNTVIIFITQKKKKYRLLTTTFLIFNVVSAI